MKSLKNEKSRFGSPTSSNVPPVVGPTDPSVSGQSGMDRGDRHRACAQFVKGVLNGPGLRQFVSRKNPN